MSSRNARFAGTAALAAILLLLPLAGKLKEARAAGTSDENQAKVEPGITTEPGTTTEKDQTDLSVTVYNSNLALVRDVRQIHLQSGSVPAAI